MDSSLLARLAVIDPHGPHLRVAKIANPSAGTDFSVTVPGESIWQLLAVTATLTASANAANRTPALKVTDGSATAWEVSAPVAITANQVVVISWIAELGFTDVAVTGGVLTQTIPPAILAPGYVLSVVTAAIDASDQWSSITYHVLSQFTGRVEREREIVSRIVAKADAIADIIEGNM